MAHLSLVHSSAPLSCRQLVCDVLTLSETNLYVWLLSWASACIYNSNVCSFNFLMESPGDSWTAARCTFGKHELAGRGEANMASNQTSDYIYREAPSRDADENEIRLDTVHSAVKGHHRPHVASFSISPATNWHATVHILVVLFGSMQSGGSETFRWLWDDTGWEWGQYKEKGIEAVIRLKRTQRGVTEDIIKPMSINVTLNNGNHEWARESLRSVSYNERELL